MFGIGMPELAMIVLVALVVLGPKRLPEVARSLGKTLAEFRRITGDVNREIDSARAMIEREARDYEASRRAAERDAARARAEAQAVQGKGSTTATDPPDPAGSAAAGPASGDSSPPTQADLDGTIARGGTGAEKP